MSTQRGANRTMPASDTDRAAVWQRWFRGFGEGAGVSIPETRSSNALAGVVVSLRGHARVAGSPGITAPLMTIIWLAWVWISSPATACCRGIRGLRACDKWSRETIADRVATRSLYSDHRFGPLAGPENLASSPPRCGAGDRRLSVPNRCFPLHTPILPVRSHLRPTLPQAPAGEVRWAERHDGKRDLYFQHAA
jgi:hypothetical protein